MVSAYEAAESEKQSNQIKIYIDIYIDNIYLNILQNNTKADKFIFVIY
jgi:hypothetical protein